MSDIIKISCPTCGTVLQVRRQPGIEKMSVACPVCKQQQPFMNFRIVHDEEKGTVTEEARGVLVAGRIVVLPSGQAFQLKPGKNVIGRAAQSSTATIQLPCINNRMSREHLVIEVARRGGGYVHNLTLYKGHTNTTRVNSMELEFGDMVELKPGMVIHLPDLDVRFEIPDSEETVY